MNDLEPIDTHLQLSSEGDVRKLFENYHIQQIKDFNISFNNRVHKVNVEFNNELNVKYKDILSVTNEVNTLFQKLKSIDSNFKELCFNDNLYQLRKIPDLSSIDDGSSTISSNKNRGGMNIESDKQFINSQLLLKISNWSLSISNFMTRFPVSSNPTILFNDMITNFNILRDTCDLSTQSYDTIISCKCKEFQNFLIDSINSSKIDFPLIEWIKLYNLFFNILPDRSHSKKQGCEHQPHSNNLQRWWDHDKVNQLESLIFNSIFQYDIDTLLQLSPSPSTTIDDGYEGNNDNLLISSFIKMEKFEKRLIGKTIDDIKKCIENIKDSTENEHAQGGKDNANLDSSTDENINIIIKQSKLLSMGLINDQRIKLFENSKPIITMIKNLKTYNCDSAIIKKLKDEFTQLLQDSIPSIKSVENIISEEVHDQEMEEKQESIGLKKNQTSEFEQQSIITNADKPEAEVESKALPEITKEFQTHQTELKTAEGKEPDVVVEDEEDSERYPDDIVQDVTEENSGDKQDIVESILPSFDSENIVLKLVSNYNDINFKKFLESQLKELSTI
ncbi:Golgi transport complex subunit COG1 NDAI_0I03060 [Naumovozyma dairenensis CBS 421]|uniref:Uncharacterized protein n=1 Tax=Naumovozyma dairenensis (strain ATCC 10597 / BCRC 20456 / CBS 421 / NBRC 0211 / NRRL Y-12639) TaxID=1071378 RepID=G0WGG3_NAUDC|nr:hypothetical protein NDAI_0I03060 [Naumovozyma dairenensis CBS 421]CCD26874.1 hypothetical protein NDAI_0I03060 [Naumovozyma dairenensis CBS 421]